MSSRHYEGIRPEFSLAERVPETPVNFTALSSQELVSLPLPRSLPSGVALLLRVSSLRGKLSFPSFVVTSRYVQ